MIATLPSSSFLPLDWPLPKGVRACITTRSGGVSRGPYEGFNLGDHVGDDSDLVSKNRDRLYRHLGQNITWFRQVHGTDVVVLPHAISDKADAVYTCAARQVCAVLTADCLPVLLASDSGDEVAAVHCGWRGLAAGILHNTLAHFRSSRDHVSAFLGPAISQAYFEVGDEVRKTFQDAQGDGRFGGGVEACFLPANVPGKWYADLYALARSDLVGIGVSRVFGGGLCTYDDPRFYSYRRAQQTGRMASLIWIEP